MEKVKCSDCGYLGLWNRDRGVVDEAPADFRGNGQLPTNFVGHKMHLPSPLCFARTMDLSRKTKGKNAVEIGAIINSPVECDKFEQWQHGFGPKETSEMIHHERMAREEREWRENRLREDRVWRKSRQRKPTFATKRPWNKLESDTGEKSQSSEF